MSVFASPRAIPDFLSLSLDAANTRSYPGSGTVWTDLSRRNNTGTLTNGPTFSSDNRGVIVFDGTNDFVAVGSSADFAYGTADFTWEFWVNLISNTGNGYIIDHGVNGGVVQYATSRLRYYNVTIGTGGALYTTGFSGALTLNTWHHLVASRISGVTYLYRNGVLSTSAADTHNYGTQSIRIGSYGSTGSFFWPGRMGLIRLYKGIGFSAQNVSDHFNALRGRYGV
jgi:hypothetical protein